MQFPKTILPPEGLGVAIESKESSQGMTFCEFNVSSQCNLSSSELQRVAHL